MDNYHHLLLEGFDSPSSTERWYKEAPVYRPTTSPVTGQPQDDMPIHTIPVRPAGTPNGLDPAQYHPRDGSFQPLGVGSFVPSVTTLAWIVSAAFIFFLVMIVCILILKGISAYIFEGLLNALREAKSVASRAT